MRHRRLLFVTLLVATVALLCLWTAKRPEPLPRAPDLLEQIHAAFEMYTEDFDGKYPPMSPKPGEFVPDMDAFGPYLARLPDGDLLSAYLTGKCGVQLCYLGYVLPSQRVTLELLNEFEKRGVAAARDKDVTFSTRGVPVRMYGSIEPRELKEVHRLREGVERFFITGIGNPAEGEQIKAWIAVLWEMPDTTPAAGGWALYMDGHTKWFPYGTFPMTGKIVTRVRDFVSPPVEKAKHGEYRVDSRPTREYRHVQGGPSPVHQLAADVADSLLLGDKLALCDTTPSVRIGRYRGYRMRFPWGGGAEIVLFPADIEVDSKLKYRIWPRGAEKRNTVLADLGVGHGYHWFAQASVWIQDNFREDLGLTGGDDRLQLMIETDAFYLMPRLGEQAVPYLESVVTDEENDNFAHAIMALDQIGTPEARKLINAAFDPDNKKAFRNAEALTPRSDSLKYRYGYALTDETVEAVVDAFLTLEDQNVLAYKAMGYATLTGMMITTDRNRIGLAVLKRLPDDIVGLALQGLHRASPSQAQRLESRLRDNQG